MLGALFLAPGAQAQDWSKQKLDQVFDGAGLMPELAVDPVAAVPGKKRILFPESDTPPAAPRFAACFKAFIRESPAGGPVFSAIRAPGQGIETRRAFSALISTR